MMLEPPLHGMGLVTKAGTEKSQYKARNAIKSPIGIVKLKLCCLSVACRSFCVLLNRPE